MLYSLYLLYIQAIIILTVKYDAIKAMKIVNINSTSKVAPTAASFVFQLTPATSTPSSSIYLNRKIRSINCDALFPRKVLEACAVQQINNISHDEQETVKVLNDTLAAINKEFSTELKIHKTTLAILQILSTTEATNKLVQELEKLLIQFKEEMDKTLENVRSINSLAKNVTEHATPLHVPTHDESSSGFGYKSIIMFITLGLTVVCGALHFSTLKNIFCCLFGSCGNRRHHSVPTCDEPNI